MTDADRAAARRLASLADQVGRASGREPWREFKQWISRGRLGQRSGRPQVPQLQTPWQDALRAEYPGLEWHTLGGHVDESRAFWAKVGTGVPGGYQKRGVCSHISQGG